MTPRGVYDAVEAMMCGSGPFLELWAAKGHSRSGWVMVAEG